VPFYVAAPTSTFDPRLPNGAAIPIEERDATEVTMLAGQRLAPLGVGARNPAFDVTPGRLVRGFVTDRGLLEPPFESAIKGLLDGSR
jgi:methylthioribose-1-phosphate isomerase